MRVAYADPPYLGCCHFYGHDHGDDGLCWNDVETHRRLIDRLGEYDAWAMSLTSTTLREILPLCPEDVRVMSWVKPFASFKPGVGVAYAWEPVIVRGGRKRTREQPTVRDWCSCNITLKKGLVGAKPVAFCHWLFEVLNMEPGDEFVDLFPGTGGVQQAWDTWRAQLCLFTESEYEESSLWDSP